MAGLLGKGIRNVVGPAEKNVRGANGHPVGWEIGDADLWWTDSLVDLRAALSGAALGEDKKTVARLQVILALRENGAH